MKGVVGNDGLALEFVSGGLSNDKEVCMEAVSNTGAALIHCSAQLRDDARSERLLRRERAASPLVGGYPKCNMMQLQRLAVWTECCKIVVKQGRS